MRSIIQLIPLNLIIFLIGIMLLFVGLYLIYPPAALIAVGIIMMAISLFGESKT